MNRQELVSKVAGNLDLPKNQVDAVIASTLDTIKKSVKKGDDVQLIGFGSFSKRKRAARAGVNPGTGEKIQIPAKTVPVFKPGSDFKTTVNTKRR